MSHHNGLPGFDAWLTTQPTGDEVEPLPRHIEEARAALFDDVYTPSEEEVYNLAYMLMRDEVMASQDEAKGHAVESNREDSEDRFGDGPL